MLRLALVLAFVLLPLAAERVVETRARSSRSYDARSLPDRLTGLRLIREDALEPEILSMLAPESYTLRVYGDDQDLAVWLYFAIYSGTDTTGAHDPAVCYPAQGWDASEPDELELALADGELMVVKSLSATLGGREERVLYWFQPASRWPTSTPREQIQRMADSLAGRSQYGFVRLSVQASRPGLEARREADARLEAIAIELGPAVRRAVTAGTDAEPR